jgi:diaminopimelate decarboxylase
MDHFAYRDGELYCEDVRAAELAERFGTPLYVYSRQTLLDHFARFQAAFARLDPLICFSVKSCQNVHLCRLLAQAGSGFDVVSGGELFRALRSGADATKIVYAGVGKSDREIDEALAAGISLFNVESPSELAVLSQRALARGVVARAALRVNPDVDAGTHAYTTTGKKETKFGVDHDVAVRVFAEARALPGISLVGIHLHIGSPVNDVEAYRESLKRGVALIDELRAAGHAIDTIDVGGGFGAYYAGGEAPPASAYADVIVPLLAGRGLRVILEPGRSIAGNAGILLMRVVHVKSSGSKRFVIADASMTELIRPALYGSYHFIWPTAAGSMTPPHRGPQQSLAGLHKYDIVGPVCETGDFLAKDRELPDVQRGDLLAAFTAGAYGMTMASNYNSRPRAAEVLVAQREASLIRRRETYEDLLRGEE